MALNHVGLVENNGAICVGSLWMLRTGSVVSIIVAKKHVLIAVSMETVVSVCCLSVTGLIGSISHCWQGVSDSGSVSVMG